MMGEWGVEKNGPTPDRPKINEKEAGVYPFKKIFYNKSM